MRSSASGSGRAQWIRSRALRPSGLARGAFHRVPAASCQIRSGQGRQAVVRDEASNRMARPAPPYVCCFEPWVAAARWLAARAWTITLRQPLPVKVQPHVLHANALVHPHDQCAAHLLHASWVKAVASMRKCSSCTYKECSSVPQQAVRGAFFYVPAMYLERGFNKQLIRSDLRIKAPLCGRQRDTVNPPDAWRVRPSRRRARQMRGPCMRPAPLSLPASATKPLPGLDWGSEPMQWGRLG